MNLNVENKGVMVSVVIPVYKTEKYLAECVDSVLAQTYRDIEVILVDDGSPDGAPAICDEYAAKDGRVTVIHKKNGGLSSARNAGIDAMHGEYVTFVDSDDIISPTAVERMLTVAAEKNADVVKILQEISESVHPFDASVGKCSLYKGDCVIRKIYKAPPQIISACGKLFKRELFTSLRFPEGLIHEDEYLMPKIYHSAKRVAFLDEVHYLYMQRPGDSIMRAPFSLRKMDAIPVLKDRIECFKEWGLRSLLKDAYGDLLSHLIYLEWALSKTEYENEKQTVKNEILQLEGKRMRLRRKIQLIKMLKRIKEAERNE